MAKNKRKFFVNINRIERILAITVSACLVLLAASCDLLQGTLSSELEAKVAAASGKATVSDSVWYYNGASSSDMSATTGNTLKIEFGQVAALSTEGLSGSFSVSYTDANGNAATVQKNLDGGVFSADGTAYYLDMSPVTGMLKPAIIKDGTASVLVKAGGFICGAGNQKGRSIEPFSKTLSVQPFWSTATLAGLTFNTMKLTAGTSIVIPVKAKVTLASDASLEITPASGSSLPAGINSGDFRLSTAADGMSILVTPSVDFYGQTFTANLYVNGIIPPLAGKPVAQTFGVNFAAAINSTDTLTLSSQSDVNREISAMSLVDDGTNLLVTFAFDGIPGGYNNDRLIVMIDDASQSTGAASYADTGWTNAASHQTVNASVEFYGFATMAASPVGMTTSSTWTQNATNWVYYANSSTVKYSIPLSSIGSGASAGHVLRVVGFFSDYWGGDGTTHVFDVVPASAATLSTNANANDAVAVDFDKALPYTVGGADASAVIPVPSAPASAVVGSYTALQVSLAWSNAYSATSYNVYRSADGSAYTAIASGLTSTSYTDSSVSPSTKYWYRISALNASGESAQTPAVSVTTKYLGKPSAPTNVSVTAHTSSSVGLSWTASDTADSYTVYRSSDNSTYTAIKTGVTSTAYTDSTVTSLTDLYYYKVSGVNAVGEGSKSAYAYTYPTIGLDGVLSSSECWTNTAVAATSSDSISGASYDISNLYVTNDATNLYIAIKFASVPTLWKDYRVTILLDNNSVAAGTAATTTATWNTGAATVLTIAAGSVEAQITTYGDGGTVTTMGGGTCGTAWSGSDASGYTPATAILEYSIPLSSVGPLSAGNTVYAYAAVSEYTWGTAAQSGIIDHIPAAAGTITWDSTWPKAEADSVNMTNALAYTIK